MNARIKSLNYLNNILAKIEGLQAGGIEALMLNEQGDVAEATGDNIFLVRDGRLVTPPTDAGSWRASPARWSSSWPRLSGSTPAEVPLTKHDVFIADECFLTGTAAEVVPASRSTPTIGDGGPGPSPAA